MEYSFKIVVTAYNCLPWLKWSLDSLAAQTLAFQACIVDDASTDPAQWDFIKGYGERYGWATLRNAENRGALYSRVSGIESLHCADEDIIITVDGDDWLARDDVLHIVGRAYEDADTLLTYGSYVTYPDGARGISRPVPGRVVRKAGYRKHRWVFSHLKTFKCVLWKNVLRDDLLDEDGAFYREATDMAMMYPMLEMAGGRIKYIERVLYVYNTLSAAYADGARRERQIERENRIRARPSYRPLRLKAA